MNDRASKPRPADPRPPELRWYTAFGLLILVAFSGACLGVFAVEWVRTDSTGFHLYMEGRAWVARILGSIPFWGYSLNSGWETFWFNAYTAHVPGLVGGAFLATFAWLALSLGAAWQNSLFFGAAVRRIGVRLLPLMFYLPAAGAKPYFDSLWFHLMLLVPFGVVAFTLTDAFRKTRAETLPKKARPAGADGAWDFLPLTLVCLFALARFVSWYHIAGLRHNNFHSQGYDLALMTHVLQNFIRGDGLVSSLIVSGGSFLGHHFSPILYLLAPFFFFCPNPELLIFAQAAAVAFAAIPLYIFAKVYLGNPWTAAALALTFLFLPGLSEGVYYDFHAISFAPILLFWLAHEVWRTDRNRYWVPALLLFGVQENAILYGLVFSIFVLFHPSLRKRGWILLGASLVALVLVFGIFQPLLRPEGELGYGFAHRYKDFLPEAKPGSSGIAQLVPSIFSNPGTVLRKTFDAEALGVYGRHWGGSLLAPLWSPPSWVLLIPCLENVLASEEMMRIWGNHYAFGPLALSSLGIVAAFGFWSRFTRFAKNRAPLSWLVLFSAVFWAMRRTQIPYSIFMMGVFYQVEIEPREMREALVAEIPYGSSVAAQSQLLPHLTYQKDLYLVPPGEPHVPIERREPVQSLLDFNAVGPSVPWPDYIVYDPEKGGQYWYNLWFHSDQWLEETQSWLDWLHASGRYVQTYPREGATPEKTLPLIVLKRADLSE